MDALKGGAAFRGAMVRACLAACFAIIVLWGALFSSAWVFGANPLFEIKVAGLILAAQAAWIWACLMARLFTLDWRPHAPPAGGGPAGPIAPMRSGT